MYTATFMVAKIGEHLITCVRGQYYSISRVLSPPQKSCALPHQPSLPYLTTIDFFYSFTFS